MGATDIAFHAEGAAIGPMVVHLVDKFYSYNNFLYKLIVKYTFEWKSNIFLRN